VWKLLYDPTRFAAWWPGWERVEPGDGTEVVHYDARWPDFAYPTSVTTDPATNRIVVSCMLSDIVHEWGIEPRGGGCRVSVRVAVPEAEAARVPDVLDNLRVALDALVAAAEA
jgi:hypothetical protein